MPSFDIVKETKPRKTFRTESVIGSFDLQVESLKQRFRGNIDIENKDWNLALSLVRLAAESPQSQRKYSEKSISIIKSSSLKRRTFSFLYK